MCTHIYKTPQFQFGLAMDILCPSCRCGTRGWGGCVLVSQCWAVWWPGIKWPAWLPLSCAHRRTEEFSGSLGSMRSAHHAHCPLFSLPQTSLGSPRCLGPSPGNGGPRGWVRCSGACSHCAPSAPSSR